MKIKIGKWYYPAESGGGGYVLDVVRALAKNVAKNVLRLNDTRIIFLNDEDYIWSLEIESQIRSLKQEDHSLK